MMDHLRYFPKAAFYPNQKDAIERIYNALLKEKIVLLEAACGTGKTLSALVPALTIAREKNKKVLIATNVHQQMTQFIEEAREIKRKGDVKAIALKGKVNMCHLGIEHDECSVLRENTFELIEAEKERKLLLDTAKSIELRIKQEPALDSTREKINADLNEVDNRLKTLKLRCCPFVKKVFESEIGRGNGDFQSWLFKDVRTPEEVIERAGSEEKCSYELLKRNLRYADLVICNYHHILNEEILVKLLAWMDSGLQDIILIFDEAHNLESAARSHSSITLSEATIERSMREVGEHAGEKSSITPALRHLKNTIRETYEAGFSFGERERIGEDWYDVIIRDPEDGEDKLFRAFIEKVRRETLDLKEILPAMEELGVKIDQHYKDQYKLGISEIRKNSSLLQASKFLPEYIEHAGDPEYYQVLNVKRDRDNEIQGRIELFSCIPRHITQPLFENIYAGVLMSATLRPFQMVRTVLGIERECEEICYGTSFPTENRCTIAVAAPPLFARNRNDKDITEIIAGTLSDIIEQSNGNILVFLPSSAEAQRYKNLLGEGVRVFTDEAGVSSTGVREEFFKIGEDGRKAVLLSYLWGTLTEGVDYKDERLRCVVIVGVGYPLLSERTRAIQNAYEHAFGNGWEYAIQNPTIRRIRQAMGRAIRSPTDYGARVLIDMRYTGISRKLIGKYSVFSSFPEEERAEFIDVEPEKVKYSLMNFFAEMKKKNTGKKIEE